MINLKSGLAAHLTHYDPEQDDKMRNGDMRVSSQYTSTYLMFMFFCVELDSKPLF